METFVRSLFLGCAIALSAGVVDAFAQGGPIPVPARFCKDVGCSATGAGCARGTLAGVFSTCSCEVAPPPGGGTPTYCHYADWF